MKRLLILGIVILFLFVSSCNKEPVIIPAPEPNLTEPEPLEIIRLEKDMSIPQEQCKERALDDKILMIVSKYCGACKVAVPKLEELEEKKGVEITYIDAGEEEGINQINELGIRPMWTPTLVAGCKVYVGGREKEEYSMIIDDFLEVNKNG